jgi:membrane protease YdiL (CAAX protease family)
MTTRGVLLLGIVITYKIAEMVAGTKTFPRDSTAGSAEGAGEGASSGISAASGGALTAWAEILLVFGLVEAVMWTPRSFGHSLLIAAVVGSVLWFGFRRHSTKELGLVWPERSGTAWILGIGCLVAIAIPVGALLTGHPVPANPDWPKFKNVWPYVIWAVGQQFLLQSFFYLRLEALLGSRRAILASVVLFTLAHLPNIPLTVMTFLGAWFFTEMFRKYRSIYPLGIVHALLGIAIAYSFPDSLMHHMRVGLSFWQFR